MEYFKHIVVKNGVKHFQFYKPDGMELYFGEDPMNTDFAKMMEGVNADPPTNTIEEVDDTPE